MQFTTDDTGQAKGLTFNFLKLTVSCSNIYICTDKMFKSYEVVSVSDITPYINIDIPLLSKYFKCHT